MHMRACACVASVTRFRGTDIHACSFGLVYYLKMPTCNVNIGTPTASAMGSFRPGSKYCNTLTIACLTYNTVLCHGLRTPPYNEGRLVLSSFVATIINGFALSSFCI